MNNTDPKGYYAILEVAVTATAAEIKAAYRRKAMETHPDRNNSSSATAAFQRLNEAYAVLSDAERRAQYDTAGLETEDRAEPSRRERPVPVACSECGKVTAQPRYVIFHEVKSFVFGTTRTPVQGIFCSTCAEKKALRATAITWLLGWWGVPWGPIFSLQAIGVNLMGGRRPADINARLAAHQAWAFAVAGHEDLAAATARDAIRLTRKWSPDRMARRARAALGYEVDEPGSQLRSGMESLLAALRAESDGPQLQDSWALMRRPFFVQAAIALTAIALIVGIILGDGKSLTTSSESYAYNRDAPSEPRLPQKAYSQTPPDVSERPAYVRPATAPNGSPWPTSAGYVAGYKKLRMKGLSTVTVDNSQNNADVFVKLVSLDAQEAYPARTFFIPAFGRFTLDSVTEGNYDIRYRDLESGALARSEPFQLTETEKEDGIEYSKVSMTLYKVAHGNMETFPITDTEF